MPDVPFATLVPRRQNRFTEADGRVTVHVPRFTSAWARRWLLPLLPRPEVRLHLDDLGSFVWHQMDGGTTVQEITGRVATRFGEAPAEAGPRVERFLRQLARADSVTFLAPAAGVHDP
jgi:hypothetical protein